MEFKALALVLYLEFKALALVLYLEFKALALVLLNGMIFDNIIILMIFFRYHSRPINILALMTISLLVWLIYMATSYGIADVFAEQAHYEMQQWSAKKLTSETWTSTQTRLQNALQLDPQNPDLLEMMGEIYYWKAQKISLTLPAKIIAYQQALDYFLQATKKRPTSSLTWGNVLMMKNVLKQYDTQFLMALKQTTIQGPSNPFVHRVVTEIGLSSWQQLSKKGQSLVLMTIERGFVGKEAKQIENLIKKYRRESVICQYSQQYQNFSTFCENFRSF